MKYIPWKWIYPYAMAICAITVFGLTWLQLSPAELAIPLLFAAVISIFAYATTTLGWSLRGEIALLYGVPILIWIGHGAMALFLGVCYSDGLPVWLPPRIADAIGTAVLFTWIAAAFHILSLRFGIED